MNNNVRAKHVRLYGGYVEHAWLKHQLTLPCPHLLDVRVRHNFSSGIRVADGPRDTQPSRPDPDGAYSGLTRLCGPLKVKAELR